MAMSRDFRDDARDDRDSRPAREVEGATDIPRGDRAAHHDLFSRHLEMPRGATRDRFEGRERDYQLNEDETRTLATIGAFRVVSTDDLLGAGGIGEDTRVVL